MIERLDDFFNKSKESVITLVSHNICNIRRNIKATVTRKQKKVREATVLVF